MSQELVNSLALVIMTRAKPTIVHLTFSSGREIQNFVIDKIVAGGILGYHENAPDNIFLVVLNNVEHLEFVL